MGNTGPLGGSPPLAYPSGAQIVLAANAPSADWHAVRRTGLGGSDMAAICGLNPYTSPLEIWFSKVGRPVPRRNDPVLDEAALMGHALEPLIATRFTALTGLLAVDGPGTLRHPSRPWIANLDRVTEDDGLPGVVELKSRSSYALKDWLDEPPVDVQVQVQHYLAVTGWDYAYTVALIGGQRTLVHRLERDEELIADLAAIAEEFWGWVESRQQPPVDGSHATGQLLDRLHAHPTRDVVVADATEVEWLLQQRAVAKQEIAAAEIALLEAENRLKAIAGDATDVHTRGELAYSWRPQPGQISWKTAALAADPGLDPEPYRGEPTRVLRVHLENL
ncbi:YqaJ viral recombinase family nuclease [Streptomyces albireticuli]|uniref:Endonuclease n=1 Tax=Streptomyces albireticuli TaxID=1940 RepID=A0A2A2D7T1_9ACTN|nr:YqaJ viral recombinase family protein [Streptomyces albireticuli]MCD9194250.1 YqaJ viral recombinase family protein [Streptomyces albireticuli]PAU47390.1 endonuclease [Streptomyces albireticuli]